MDLLLRNLFTPPPLPGRVLVQSAWELCYWRGVTDGATAGSLAVVALVALVLLVRPRR